ncbi:MAG: hypothetical protein IJ121_03810 [Eubacterium sp.]|nr:hypothetical protein [Eubacterium sp.]
MENRYMIFTNTIASLYQSVQKIRAMEMDHFDLKTGHVTCLLLLFQHPDGITHKQLTELCEMDKAAVSRYVTTLRERGFITEIGADKRYNRKICLTDEGMRVAKETAGMVIRAVENGSADMSDAERSKFYERMQQISDNLQNYIEEMEKERRD